MDIIPHVGIDDTMLGSARELVADALGEPDRRSKDFHEDGEISEIWIYRLMRLELSFDSDHNYRLSHITTYHPYSLVSGFNPIGLTAKFLLQKFPHLELDLEITDDEKYFSDRILDLTYGVADGKVVSITVFPEVEAVGDTIRWPTIRPQEDKS